MVTVVALERVEKVTNPPIFPASAKGTAFWAGGYGKKNKGWEENERGV